MQLDFLLNTTDQIEKRFDAQLLAGIGCDSPPVASSEAKRVEYPHSEGYRDLFQIENPYHTFLVCSC